MVYWWERGWREYYWLQYQHIHTQEVVASCSTTPVASEPPTIAPEELARIVGSMRRTLDLLNRTRESIRTATDAAMDAARKVGCLCVVVFVLLIVDYWLTMC